MGNPTLASRMFKIKSLFGLNLDIALYNLPHHGLRTKIFYDQHLINPENTPLTIETMAENIHDLHSSILWLKKEGYDQIGIIGGSLGGYSAALYATLYSEINFIFTVVPSVNLSHVMAPKSKNFNFKITKELIHKTDTALEIITPDYYQPKLDSNKIVVVMHSGDKLNLSSDTHQWIKKWSISNVVEITGGHWIYFDRKKRGKTWYEWLRKMEFI